MDMNSMDDAFRYYEIDKVLLPLMVHQNYVNCISKNVYNRKYDIINELSEYISKGDIIENCMYRDQNWELQGVHGLYTCVITSHIINNTIKKRPFKSHMKFPVDMTRTKSKNKNKENINYLNDHFRNMSSEDYIFIYKIMKKMLQKGEIEECANILNFNII